MNKKIHLLVAALGLFVASSVNAQTVLSQTGGAVPDEGSIGCSGQSGMSDNRYFRAYTMSSNMDITTMEIGVGSVVFTQQGVNSFPITVKLHKSNGAFPGSFSSGLTLLATATASLSASTLDANGDPIPEVVEVAFSAPISVASGDIIVAEVSNAAVTNGSFFFMGAISGSETAPAYLISTTCQLTTPTSIGTIQLQDGSFPNGKIVIDLTDKPLSVENFFKENFSMYPNPVTDVLNIDSINGLSTNEIRVMDLTGKVIKVQNNASSVNVADLATGTYLIEITTNEGKGTSKFIKK